MSSFSSIKSKEMEITIVMVSVAWSFVLVRTEFDIMVFFLLLFRILKTVCTQGQCLHHMKILRGPLLIKGKTVTLEKGGEKGETIHMKGSQAVQF